MASENVFETSDANFERDVLQCAVPCLVDFWAVWCGPCRALAPLLDEVATHLIGKAKVFKVNTDDNPNTPSQYGVRGIPTVMLFKNGKVVDQSVGVVSKQHLEEMVTKSLG